MKILFLIPRMGGGGAERVVSIIANNLCGKKDIQITTLVSNESFYKLNANVKFTSANYCINRASKLFRFISMGKNFVSSIFYVRKTICEFEPDIVFSLLEEMDIVTYLARTNLHGFAWICSERNDPTRRSKKLQKILEHIYKKVDILVCQSKTVSDYYAMVPENHKTVIPNPVDFRYYPEKTPESVPSRIVGVGRLVPQKNFSLLVDAFAKVTEDFPLATVTVYGEGPERKTLEDKICSAKLSKAFFLPGASKSVLDEIKDAAIFALPTNFEGFPNVLVEAIAMGIPVVSTDFATGIAKEIVTEHVGLVVPCGDANAFAAALKALLADDAKRQSIRNQSWQAVEPFEVSKIVSMWESLFEKLGDAYRCQEL